ncbi:Bug family tripartite tricarboxylate transporter substrate binding protein [Bordetella tumulicola]|uniref:Bug family tripartite tricarboxylate transporter substrate binding protein n=1 Tax=Bordetella tumulicola TaxID=1649133 RepID=UPI0039EDE9C2
MKKVIAALMLSCVAFSVTAQTPWPKEKPVQVVVPFPAGGATDTIGRLLAEQLQRRLDQSFVVYNRAGATGTIGAAAVQRAEPDGYTLMMSSLGTYVIAPHLIKSTSYDALKDFDYISVLVQAPNVLVAAPSKSVRTVQDVIAELKSKPGQISFANSGYGASDHLSAEVFLQQTQTAGMHVAYKGGAPAINDLMGSQVDYSFQNVNAVLPHIRAGKLRAIAVTGSKRSAVLPDVPTLTEAGVPNAVVYSWQGLSAPKGLPAEVKDKLSKATIASFRDPAVVTKLEEQGLEIVANTPEEFTAFQAEEFYRWKALIEERGIVIE